MSSLYKDIIKVFDVDLSKLEKDLAKQYNELKKVKSDWDKAQNNSSKYYRKQSNKIKKENKNISEYELNKIMQADPEYKPLKKETDKMMQKHARLSRKFKSAYNEYLKNGGEKVLEWYQAATEWDDAD